MLLFGNQARGLELSGDISTLFAKPKAGKGKPGRELSETTKTRLKTIPGAEALVERVASNAK